MMFLILAWRNLWGNRRRTVITLAAISLNTAILIASYSLMEGLLAHTVSNATNMVVGEVQIDEIYDVVLPGGMRRLRASYPANLRPGRFRADVTVDFGADAPATATRDFTAR